MTTSTALVGPLKVGKVRFGGGPHATYRDAEGRFVWIRTNATAIYTPPANTLDPRYDACIDHHVACDCREAEHAENQHEARLERGYLAQAIDSVLSGHPTGHLSEPGCMCTGCQIARLVHIYPKES